LQIDKKLCSGCGRCHDMCTMACISFARSKDGRVVSEVLEDECVDCGVCERSGVCSLNAISMPVVSWPRTVRGTFSNPLAEHKETKVPGRGTEEMKTSDVTGRFRRGYAGISIELGRPGVGARLRNAGKFGRRLHEMGVRLEPKNPLTMLLNPETGDTLPEVADEKVLSAILEFIVPEDRVAEVLEMVNQVQREIDTVVSVDLVYRCGEDIEGTPVPLSQALSVCEDPYPNGKLNVGLGRPRYEEVPD
jgi:NAD-dependent dihydropyrimidine dehydrogenase PreA subunit